MSYPGNEANAEIYERVRAYLPENRERALDIGAYHGEWSRLMAPDFKEVVAFEVVPKNFQVLVESVPDNVVPLNLGLSIWTGSENFEMRENYAQRSGRRDTSVIYAVMYLDHPGMAKHLGKVDFVKLDVDGSEWDVIHGSIELFRRHKPVLCIEVKLLNGEARAHLLKFLHYKVVDQVSAIDEVWAWDG